MDLIDVSTGGLIPDVTIPVKPDYQVPFAEQVRSRAGIPTTAVGLITKPKQAKKILKSAPPTPWKSAAPPCATRIGRSVPPTNWTCRSRKPPTSRHTSAAPSADPPSPSPPFSYCEKWITPQPQP
mgnify:CR=1 FL=1